MRPRENAIRRALVITFLLLATGAADATELIGRVVGVSDGDTLTLLENAQQHKVRIAGIDAPERRQAYGERARQHLADLVYGKTVRVAWDKRDRYGRVVGRVFVPQCEGRTCRAEVDAGLEQIRAGLAWHYRHYEREQSPEERARYSATEQQARARREGLWKDPHAVPPWEFRNPAVTISLR